MVSRFAAVKHPESVLACHVNMLAAGPPSWYKQPIAFVRFMIWAIMNAKNPESMLGRMMWWRNDESGTQIPLLKLMISKYNRLCDISSCV
jgi:hypothetical protein